MKNETFAIIHYFTILYISTNSSLKVIFHFSHFGSSSLVLSAFWWGLINSSSFSFWRSAATYLEVLVVILSFLLSSSWTKVPVLGGGTLSLVLKAGTAFPMPDAQFLRSWAFNVLSVSAMVGCWASVPWLSFGCLSFPLNAGTAFPIPEAQFFRSWAFSFLSVSAIVGYSDLTWVLILAFVYTRLQSWNLHLMKWKKFPMNSAF